MPVCGRLPEGGEAGLIRGGLSWAASPYPSHEIVAWTEPNAGFTPAAMNDEPKTPPGEALALARFALIAKIQDLLRQGFPLSLALEQVSICPLTLPDGSQRVFALRTLEDWWYDYQHNGFAGLRPQDPRRQRPGPHAHPGTAEVDLGTGSGALGHSGQSALPPLEGTGSQTGLHSIPFIAFCASTNYRPRPAASFSSSLWAGRPSVSRRPLSMICG